MPDWSTTYKVVIPIILGLMTIGGGIFAMEDRYVTQQEAGQSLQSFNEAVQKDLVNLEVQILNTQKESLTDQYHKQRSLVRQNPGDDFYREELERIEKRLEKIDEKIEQRLEVGQ